MSKFNFKSFPKRNWTQVERSTFSRNDIVESVSDTAEDGCEKVNRVYTMALEADVNESVMARGLLDALRKQCLDLMAEIEDPQGIFLCEQKFKSLEVI